MIRYEYARASGLAEPVAPVVVAKTEGTKGHAGTLYQPEWPARWALLLLL